MKIKAMVIPVLIVELVLVVACQRVPNNTQTDVRSSDGRNALSEREDSNGDWIVTDKETSCQYIEAAKGGITPRLGITCGTTPDNISKVSVNPNTTH